MDVAGTVAGRAAGVVGTALDGVIGAALAGTKGDLKELAGTAVDAATNVVSETFSGTTVRSGSSSKSSGSSSKSTGSSKQSTPEPSQIIKNIMSGAGLSQDEATIVKELCENCGITNDLNMAEVGIVWKKASASEKKQIVAVCKELMRQRDNGKNFEEAIKSVEKYIDKSSTKTNLKHMWEHLH